MKIKKRKYKVYFLHFFSCYYPCLGLFMVDYLCVVGNFGLMKILSHNEKFYIDV